MHPVMFGTRPAGQKHSPAQPITGIRFMGSPKDPKDPITQNTARQEPGDSLQLHSSRSSKKGFKPLAYLLSALLGAAGSTAIDQHRMSKMETEFQRAHSTLVKNDLELANDIMNLEEMDVLLGKAITQQEKRLQQQIKAGDQFVLKQNKNELAQLEAQFKKELAPIQQTVISPEIIAQRMPASLMITGQTRSVDENGKTITGMGIGSGVFVQDAQQNTFIITNNHVIDDIAINWEQVDAGTQPPLVLIQLYSGTTEPGGYALAMPIAQDKDADLAVLKVIVPSVQVSKTEKGLTISTDEAPAKTKFVPPAAFTADDFRDLEKEPLKLGEAVGVMGAPSGLFDSFTKGSVSNAERFTPLTQGVRGPQTDAAINGGNSGGAMIDRQGRLIGIVNSKIENSDGLGFAIGSNAVLNWLEKNGIPLSEDTAQK